MSRDCFYPTTLTSRCPQLGCRNTPKPSSSSLTTSSHHSSTCRLTRSKFSVEKYVAIAYMYICVLYPPLFLSPRSHLSGTKPSFPVFASFSHAGTL
ncbi:hypothetical protein K435DRAFT_486129 [Dendrothele bispora CBS 962.96]|uniref:Uncharacterized protein n=1 Tax=Dendrothele bispora (strain CBS 962.96) TaxID=1314807 RepID=A0A4S8MB58_DENBC|nr:hypothetical protein K435DRAFT_486129 [Dendrothele bispora CBS 962.96]